MFWGTTVPFSYLTRQHSESQGARDSHVQCRGRKRGKEPARPGPRPQSLPSCQAQGHGAAHHRAHHRLPHRSMISESCIRARNWLSLRISRTAPLNSRLCLWISLFLSCSSLVLPCFLPNSRLTAESRRPGGNSLVGPRSPLESLPVNGCDL